MSSRGDESSPWNALNRILAATDGSASSIDAVAFAVELAVEHNSELTFVHVVPTLDVLTIDFEETPLALPHEPTSRDNKVLEDAAALAAESGVMASTELLGGSTAEEIVAYAESADVDLIVVGSRGHGAVASALIGSVSLGVLRRSSRPVLIVRANSTHPTRRPSPAERP